MAAVAVSFWKVKGKIRNCPNWTSVLFSVCLLKVLSNNSFRFLFYQMFVQLQWVLQVLERGPVIYHQVVLGLVCSLMKFGDFSSPSMRHFQNDALKTISKYLKVSNNPARRGKKYKTKKQ